MKKLLSTNIRRSDRSLSRSNARLGFSRLAIPLGLMLIVGALTSGCGKDAVDAESDEATEATAHAGGKLPAGVSPFGSSANVKQPNGAPVRSGPPTSPPPQLAPGQGVGSLYGRKTETKSNPDLDLPK